MTNNGIFSQSYIERDLAQTGGPKVIARVFGNTLDFEGVIVQGVLGYALIADIVPDQSRIFSKVKVRINGLDVQNYSIHVREDGLKVVSVVFQLDPDTFKAETLQVDVVWNYTEEDIARPDVFKSTIITDVASVVYEEKKLAPGLTQLTGGYGIQANDFFKVLGYVTLVVNPLTVYYSSLRLRYYPNYKDYPERYEIVDLTNRLAEIPFEIKKKVFVDLDTLKVQNKKFELVWTTQDGELIETLLVDTDTLGYATGFSAPVPVELNLAAYQGIDLSGIYRNFVFHPEYKSFYKGNHELRGRNLSFKTKLPIELSLQSFKLKVLVNGTEVGYTTNPSSDSQYSYVQYDVPLESFSEVNSVEVSVDVVYPNAVEISYGVVFTELF